MRFNYTKRSCLLTFKSCCSKLLGSKSKTKILTKTKNIALFATLKVARAVSQSQRVVSAKYFLIRADLLPAAPRIIKLRCRQRPSQYFMQGYCYAPYSKTSRMLLI